MSHLWDIMTFALTLTISLDNKDSCWIVKDFYCSVTMLYSELGLITIGIFCKFRKINLIQ